MKLNLTDTTDRFARIRTTEGQKVIKNLLLLILSFLGVYVLINIVWLLIALLCWIIVLHLSGTDILEGNAFIVFQLYITVFTILIVFAVCLSGEKRPLRTLGITGRRCLPDYLTGAAAGLAMFSAVMGIAIAGGAVTFDGVNSAVPVMPMILLFIGWMIQGFSEELTFRGYILMSAGTHQKPWTAVLISSVLFGLVHLGNPGVSAAAVVNIILFGVVTALYFLRTDSIWGCAALHSVWNWAQGNFYGLKVSGLDTAYSVLHCSQIDGKAWLNGGDFGMEGGIATTAVLAVTLLVLFLLPARRTDAVSSPVSG